jgi:methylmalonyl-CoA mutase
VAFLRSARFDLVIVETAGIGQSDSEIVDLVDIPVYVMTSEFGAASQLEKIDMLDLAEVVVINKFDKRGALDALRDVRKQWRRNRVAFELADEDVPVYATIASQFNDPGVSWVFVNLCRLIGALPGGDAERWVPHLELETHEPLGNVLIPGSRVRYLSEIAEQGRAINARVEREADHAATAQHCYEALRTLGDAKLPEPLEPYRTADLQSPDADEALLAPLREHYNEALEAIGAEGLSLLRGWDEQLDGITGETYSYTVRDREITGDNYRTSLSGQQIPKIAPPRLDGWADRLRFALKENLPGSYPYTGGVFPYRRAGEDPTRMFAGEGTPERTNRRFHYLSAGQPAARLSTAFDSVTLYGADPAERPDIYGKVGNAGVSIATVDDAKKLYSGFDLCAPTTSVSMTINGPAPIILAFFMNAAIDQQVERHLHQTGGWDEAQRKLDSFFEAHGGRPAYAGELPDGNEGLGLGLLGASGDMVVEPDVYERIKAETLRAVRGTVQADILKEDQAQNTCIFSTEFALKMMGDVQQYFSDNGVRNFYSVSISGYHIAEAGANPISQLAFTLANGFTIVEYYLARGMEVDAFAPNLSFFFSNGMDPEYAVIGRVARRIWARAMRERYGALPRSQMLKYHIQTSGRSLHAQEISFNDIRTTLQALYAIFDNTNSLHTNAYDEAITTPTEESVRRAVAIQLIINRELGLNFCENPWQGSFIVSELTDLVERAVYEEFDRISERGGVLGAMDTMYQRSKIQEESLYYERLKHGGELPLIGVNTYLPRDGHGEQIDKLELMRSTDAEKQTQIANVRAFQDRGADRRAAVLDRLQDVARERGNVFEALIEAVKVASLGQISDALYEVGGEYRRNM